MRFSESDENVFKVVGTLSIAVVLYISHGEIMSPDPKFGSIVKNSRLHP